MKKIATTFVITILMVMAIFIMPPNSYAAIEIDDYQVNEAGRLERAFTNLALMIGDFMSDLLNVIIGEKISIQGIVFNDVTALDANFFNKETVALNETTEVIRDQVNYWYSFFTGLAITVYLIVLLVIGIKVALGSTAPGALGKIKELTVKWLVGLLLLFFFPNVVVKYAFELNEVIVSVIKEGCAKDANGGAVGDNIGTMIGTTEGEWATEAIEFRSPEYISRFTGKSSYGDEQMNLAYKKTLASYQANADLARIMRAYAGITKSFIYVIIWFVLFGQLIVLTIKYYKRYFMIAILIIVFPLVTIYYIIEIARGKNGQVFSAWSKEMFVNIFIQSVHAVIYAIITSVSIAQVQNDIKTGADSMNWLLIIIAINFMTEGEKILRKLLGFDSSSMTGIGDTKDAVHGKVEHAAGQIKQAVPKG